MRKILNLKIVDLILIILREKGAIEVIGVIRVAGVEGVKRANEVKAQART